MARRPKEPAVRMETLASAARAAGFAMAMLEDGGTDAPSQVATADAVSTTRIVTQPAQPSWRPADVAVRPRSGLPALLPPRPGVAQASRDWFHLFFGKVPA